MRKHPILWAAVAMLLLTSDLCPLISFAGESACGRFVNEVSNWRAYRDAVMDGRFPEASTALDRIATSLADADLPEFWDTVIPPAGRVTLAVSRVCEKCGDGKCAPCGGSGLCPECKGELKCGSCGGRGQSVQPCTNCVCAACKGTGFCQICLASKTAVCPVCRGRKQSQASRAVPCSTCKGTGKLTSTGFSGETSRTCPNCRGKKTISESHTVPCAKCGGQGVVSCPTCSGNGFCAVCKGEKRKSGCKFCNDTGSITTVCQRCSGAGKCTSCKGWKKCGSCEGSGNCSLCSGTSIVNMMRLPVDKRWLVRAEGCIVEKASAWSLLGTRLEPGKPGLTSGFVSAGDCTSLKRNGIKPVQSVPADEVIVISETTNLEWVRRNVVP